MDSSFTGFVDSPRRYDDGYESHVRKYGSKHSNINEEIGRLMFRVKYHESVLAGLESKLNKVKGTVQSNIGHGSTTRTTPIDLETQLTRLDGWTIDDETYTSTEENCGHSDPKAVNVQGRIGTVESTVNGIKDNHAEYAINMQFKVDPIGALEALCVSRDWVLPKYHTYVSGDKKEIIFLVKCTAMNWTVTVNGLVKAEATRSAAAKMYYKIKNVDGNIFLGNACFGRGEEPIVATEGIAPAVLTLGNDTAKIDNVPMLDMTKKVDHPVPVAEPDTRRLVDTIELPGQNTNYVTSAKKESVSSPCNNDLAKRLRLSNNPSARELKEFNSISENTIPSCIDLLCRIVEEEKLTMKVEFSNSAPPIGKDFTTVQPSTSELKTFGCGETMYESQEIAARECLKHFKLMLIC